METESGEINLTTCRKCLKIKIRIQDGMYDDKNKKWVDETGAAWCGRKCPDCHRDKMANHMKKKRLEDE